MKKLYLYLASRSKQGVKLVTVLQSEETVNDRLSSLDQLNLPQVWQQKIAHIVHDHRMLYEPRLETAENFEELKGRLKGRGYNKLPMGAIPLLHMQAYRKAPMADTSSCKITKTMIRKKKG